MRKLVWSGNERKPIKYFESYSQYFRSDEGPVVRCEFIVSSHYAPAVFDFAEEHPDRIENAMHISDICIAAARAALLTITGFSPTSCEIAQAQAR